MIRRPPRSPLFPYPALFHSALIPQDFSQAATAASVVSMILAPMATRLSSSMASAAARATSGLVPPWARAAARAQGGTRPLVARAAAEAIEDDRRVAIGARIIETTEAAVAAWEKSWGMRAEWKSAG